jgi:uncharacterized protein YggU (UPF0235/DUF167 family)
VTRLRLRVVPGTTHPGIVGRLGDAWKVRVTAPPEAGRANEAVLTLLADALGVRRRGLVLASGHASRDKVVTLAGLMDEDVDARLAAAVKAAT